MAATKIIGIKALIELIFEKQGLENAQKDITKLQSNLNKVFKEVQNIQKGFRAKYGDTDSLIPDKELDKQATNALKSIGRVKKALVEMAGSLQAGGKLTGDQLTDLAAVIKKLKELEVIQENFKNTSAGTASELTKNFTIGPAAVQSVEVLQIAFNRLERDLVRTSKQIEQNKMGQGLPGAEGIKKDVGTIAGVLGSMTTTLENASREYNDLMTQVQKRSGDIKKAGSIELLPDAHAEKIQRNAREIIHDLELITASARGLAESAVFITRFKEQYAGISPSEALERVAAHTEAQANRIRTSLDLEINKQFMGGEFDASLQAVRGFATQASDLFDGMHRAVKKNAQGIKADTDSIGDEALEAAKKLSSIPEFKQIVDIGDLNKTRQGFQGLGNEISGLLDRWTQLQIKTKDKDIGALFKNSPAVRAEMKKLHLDLDILLNKMQELSTNPDKIQFLPPGAVSVLELVKRNLTDVAIKFNDIKNTKSGDLGALNFKALEGTLGALRLGWSNVSKEIGKTTGDTVAFTTAMEAATKQFNAGRIEAAIKPLRSISLNMLEIKKQAEAMGNTLPDVIRKLNSMTIAQREAFFTRPVNDGSEQAKLAIQAWEEEYKDLRAEVALVANGTEKLEGFFKRALTSAAQLGREGEESFKKLSKQYAALQQISNLLKGTATGEVFGATKAADISFFENLDKQFGKGSEITALAANIHKNVQQPLKELSRDAKVAEGEISNLNVRLAEMGTTANAPMEVIDRVEKLGSVAGTTNQTIITLRDNVQDAMTAPVSDSVTDEIKDMGESARTTQAAQENLVQSTRELGGAQQSLADDMAYIDMVMESLEQDYNQYADRAEQAENASRGFGEAVETTSRTIAESSGVIRVHEQNTDRMLEIMEKAAAFKGLQQRLEEDIRRIREEDRVIEALNEEFGKMTREQREIAQSGGAVENVMRSLGSQALNMTGDFRDAHAAMVKFSAELRQVRQEAAKPTRLTNLIDDKGWREAPGLIARAAVALDDYTLSARKAAAESRVLTLAQKSMEKEVHQQKSLGNKLISNVVEGVFHGIGYEAINVLQMGLYRLKDFVAQSNTIFKDFGKGLAEIYTIMPEASDAMRMQLADDVDFIAKTYGYLQGELLPAMYQALSLGVKPEGVTGTIETAARAARASVSELAPTLETGQALVNAYGGDLYSLDQIYDSLFFTIKNGSVTMRDLNANMSPITAVAGDVGVAFEDITAAITVMSRQGDSMGTISQMLSNMLTQIQLSETALGKAFTNAADMDFRTFIAQGGTLVEAMRLLQKHAEETGTTIAELTGGSSPFFRDQQSMLAVLELTGKHLEDLESATRGAYNAAGSMNAAYGEVDNTLFLLDQQSAATAESLQRDLGEAMQPMQRAWLEFKIAAVGAFQGIPIEIFKGNIQELNKELGYTREQLNEIYYLALYNDPDARSWVQKIFGTGDSKSALDVFEATFDDFSARMKSGEDITAVFAASFDEMWAHITAETKRGADEQAMAMRAVELAMMSGTMFSPEEIQQIIEKTLAVTAVQERYARAIK